MRRRARTPALAVVLIVLAIVAGVVSFIIVQGQSAMRAYVAAESYWSKAQRDASFSLYRYGVTGDPVHLTRFNEAIDAALGDRVARLEMLKPSPDRAVVEAGLLAGGNHPDDLDLMFWSFRCCYRDREMARILDMWEQGDQLLFALQRIALELEAETRAQYPSAIRRGLLLDEIEHIGEEVRPIQATFTDALGQRARLVSKILMVFSTTVGLLLAGLGTHVIRRGMRSIRDSDAQYRVLMQSAGAGFVVSDLATDRIFEANRRVGELTGESAPDLIGRPFGSLFRASAHARIGAAFPSAPVSAAEAQAATPPDAAQVQTRRLVGIDGRETEVEVTIRPTNWYGRPARLAVIHDVSARLRTERELRVANDAIANMAEAIIITDHRFVIASVNRAFTTITGFEARDVVGHRHPALTGGAPPARLRAVLRSLAAGGHWQGEFPGLRRSGEGFPRQMSFAAVRDDDGRVTHFVCIFTDHSAFRDYERRLRQLADGDALTGLLNRASFAERGERLVARARASGRSVAMLYIDLDGFKFINDNYGHGAGDHVLKTVAERIRTVVSDRALVARIGGDEFNLLVEVGALSGAGAAGAAGAPGSAPGADPASGNGVAADIDAIQKLAAPLLATIADPIPHDGRMLSLSASIGVARCPQDATELAPLVACADVAMYQAKRRGRNNVQLYRPEVELPAGSRRRLAEDLRAAIDGEAFQLWFQPQIALATGRIVAFEALLRWQHPELGWVPPALFIPITEEIGAFDAVSDWVIRMACRQGVAWQQQGFGAIPVTANLSPRSFWDRDLPARVRAILAETGWPASLLCLEVTEGTLMAGDNPAGAMARLRELGVRFAIDDFGVGYSSLTTLRRLPLDILKLDRSFIAGVPGDSGNVALLRSILGLAADLSLTVIAEGVETDEQRRLLLVEGCPQAQGYLFGRPAPAADCAAWLTAAARNGDSRPLTMA